MGQAQDRPQHTGGNTQNNRIGEDIFPGAQQQCTHAGLLGISRRCKGKCDNGNDIVEGDCAHNHQCGHRGVSVDIVDKGNA